MDIVVANSKGGCGKTTIAAHLACALAAHSKKNITLIDYDKQNTLTDWARTRQTIDSPISSIKVTKGSLAQALDTAEGIFIHDLAAGDLPLNAGSHKLNNPWLIIPVLPSAADIKCLLRYTMKIERSGLTEGYNRVGIIANRVKEQALSCQMLLQYLEAQQIELLTTLSQAESYSCAMGSGLTCFDKPLKSNAKVRAQWQPLLHRLNTALRVSRSTNSQPPSSIG